MSMAAGKIKTNDTGNPTIVCGWHGSEFNLKDGSCKQWCMGPGAYLGSKETNAIAYKTRIDNNCVYLDW
jgi:nitrite reductase/ring-hydroxylating ferredoxin subunit